MCILYLIFLSQFFEETLGLYNVTVHKSTVLLITLIPLAPLTMVGNIHFFHRTSEIGLTFALISLSIVMANGWYLIYKGELELNIIEPFKI